MAASTFLAMLLVFTVYLNLSAGQSLSINSGCATTYDPNQDYFADGFKNETFALPIQQASRTTAEDYTIAYNMSYKILQSKKEVYVLYQCGTPKPTVTLSAAASKYFEVPFGKFAIDSTVMAAFLGLLGVTGQIARADLSYAFSPCLHKLQEDGTILKLNSSNLLELNGLSAVITSTGMNATTLAASPKFIDFGSATGDKGPLKRAEWIKYLSTLFNKEALATKVYSTIEANYNCQASVYGSSATKPTVLWLSEYPDGYITFSNASYKMAYVNDAGGKSLDSSLYISYNTSVPSELAALHAALKGVDVLIDEMFIDNAADYNISVCTSKLKIPAANVNDFKFLFTKNVWKADRLMAAVVNDGYTFYARGWFEGAVAEPHVVLNELAYAIHPTSVTTRAATYFRNIAAGEPVVIQSSKDCVNPSATNSPTVIPCPVPAGSNVGQAPPSKKNSAPGTNSGLLVTMALAAVAGIVLGTL